MFVPNKLLTTLLKYRTTIKWCYENNYSKSIIFILYVTHKQTQCHFYISYSFSSSLTSWLSSSFSVGTFLLNGLLHSMLPPQAQNIVQVTYRPVHPQLSPLQARSDSQLQRISLSTASGVRGTPTTILSTVQSTLTSGCVICPVEILSRDPVLCELWSIGSIQVSRVLRIEFLSAVSRWIRNLSSSLCVICAESALPDILLKSY